MVEMSDHRKDRLEGVSLRLSNSNVWVSASIQPFGTAIVPVIGGEIRGQEESWSNEEGG